MDENVSLATITTAKPLNDFQDLPSKPWDRLPNEDSLTYEFFLSFLYIGPTRTIQEAYRQLLLKSNRLVPGQPAPDVPEKYRKLCANWNFIRRALAWDERNWSEESAIMEKTRRDSIQLMVERQIEGWRVLQEASILSFFARNENGSILRDEDNNPVVEMIEDKGIALRAWKQSVSGERTARGLPAELLALTTEEIQRRIVSIHTEIETIEDVVDAEFTEN